MSVSIRLRREGTKNRPFYRIVVADKRSPRDGKFLEAIGNYDPRQVGENSLVDLVRMDHWIKNGAKPSSTVASIVLKARKKAANAPAEQATPAQSATPAERVITSTERDIAPAERDIAPAERDITPAERSVTEPATAG